MSPFPFVRQSQRALLVLALASCATVASAQTTSTQPTSTPPSAGTHGVFAGAASRGEASSNGLMISVAEAYDDNTFADVGVASDSPLQVGGFYTDVTANLNMRFGGRRHTQFVTGAGTDVRYYSLEKQLVGVGHYGNAGVLYSSNQTSFALDGSVAYAPSYLHRLFAAVGGQPVGDAVASNFAVSDASSYSYDSRVSLTRNFDNRNRLTLRGGGRYTDVFNATSPLPDLASYEAGVTLSHGVSRDLSLVTGYTYRRAQYYTGRFPT